MCAAVLTRANGGKLTPTECVVGFLLTTTLSRQLLTVGHNILLIIGERWRTLLTNSMLRGLRPASTVVRLFVPLSIGLEAACKPMFTLPVITPVSAAPFNFGGLKTNRRLRVLLCSPVVPTKTLTRE